MKRELKWQTEIFSRLLLLRNDRRNDTVTWPDKNAGDSDHDNTVCSERRDRLNILGPDCNVSKSFDGIKCWPLEMRTHTFP